MAAPDQSDDTARAVEHLRNSSTGLVITGRIVNGQLELDQQTTEEIAQRFPDANRAFIAMNAPFDPKSQPVS